VTLTPEELSQFTPPFDTNNEDNETTKHENNKRNREVIQAMPILRWLLS